MSGPKVGETTVKVYLGLLSRIRQDSSTCDLCALFIHIISRQGGVYNTDQTLNAENIFFRADPDLSYYGRISDARKPGGATWIPRRLSLTAHSAEDPDSVIAYFDHVLQACEIETALSIPRENDNHIKKPERTMQFGGRRRRNLVDIELIKRWMRICEEEHSLSCILTTSQEEHAQ
jgi:hypothetical protein